MPLQSRWATAEDTETGEPTPAPKPAVKPAPKPVAKPLPLPAPKPLPPNPLPTKLTSKWAQEPLAPARPRERRPSQQSKEELRGTAGLPKAPRSLQHVPALAKPPAKLHAKQQAKPQQHAPAKPSRGHHGGWEDVSDEEELGELTPAAQELASRLGMGGAGAAPKTRRRSDHGHKDHGHKDHGKSDHGKSDHGKPDHGKPDHGKPSAPARPRVNHRFDALMEPAKPTPKPAAKPAKLALATPPASRLEPKQKAAPVYTEQEVQLMVLGLKLMNWTDLLEDDV